MLALNTYTRFLMFTSVICATLVIAMAARGALGSDDGPQEILQGDLNCDGLVDHVDTLAGLRALGGLTVEQAEGCPEIGAVAARPALQARPDLPANPGPAASPGRQSSASSG